MKSRPEDISLSQPSFGLRAMQKGSSVGRTVGRSVGAGEKDLSTDGESDWLEEGGNEERKGEGN